MKGRVNIGCIYNAALEEKLFNALVSYFRKENYKLRLSIADFQIDEICKILLYGNERLTDEFPSWRIGEKTILDEYHKEDLEIIDYLHLISEDLRKQLGQYATPINIVRYILKSVEYTPLKNILDKKLIDPACGSGAFLAKAVRIYLRSLKKAHLPIYKWYPMVISAISGIDIDPAACFFARLNLSVLLAPAILEYAGKFGTESVKPLPIYCANTLQLIASEKREKKLFYNEVNLKLKNRFDFVVGNPPYFKIKDLNDDLKDVFSDSIYGHPNAYGLFIHAGIEMLKEKGKLGFIIPRSMLSGLYFKNLRNFIEKKTSVKEIVYISERKKVFDDVLHGTMILSLARHNQNKESVAVSFAQSSEDIGTHHTPIHVERDKIIQRLNGTTVWFIADSPEIYTIINHIIKRHPLLSGQEINYKAKTGQIVWNRVKPLLTTAPMQNTLPLVWATDVGKFRFTFNRLGNLRPSHLKITTKTENLIIKGLCILVQRVTADEQPSRIVACIPEEFYKKQKEGYFVENHLNVIQPVAKRAEIDPYFILGILNSEIVDFFFRAMNGNTQVSATELNLLPIPIGKHEDEISRIADAIQKSRGEEKRKNLMAKLNYRVAKAYGLNDKEVVFIREFLERRWKNDN